MKKIFVLIMSIVVASVCYGETEGDKLFKTNQPEAAVPVLEKEIAEGTNSYEAYNYLGLANYQLGKLEESVEAFGKGLKVPGTNKKILSFNQGNTYFAMGEYGEAAKAYSLTISSDPEYTKALLNRANAYLMAKDYEKTIEDYEKYLQLEPEDEQKENIEEILALLRQELVRLEEEAKLRAAEEARLAEEEAKFAAEMERQRIEQEKRDEEARLAREKEEAERRAIEEEKRAQEAERRRKLLEDVANSLQQTDSTNLSSGAEDLIDYDYESELD